MSSMFDELVIGSVPNSIMNYNRYSKDKEQHRVPKEMLKVMFRVPSTP